MSNTPVSKMMSRRARHATFLAWMGEYKDVRAAVAVASSTSESSAPDSFPPAVDEASRPPEGGAMAADTPP